MEGKFSPRHRVRLSSAPVDCYGSGQVVSHPGTFTKWQCIRVNAWTILPSRAGAARIP